MLSYTSICSKMLLAINFGTLIPIKNIPTTVIFKSVDGVLRIRTRGCRLVGADEAMYHCDFVN